MEFRLGVCSAALPVIRPSQSSSVKARQGPDSGVGTPLPPTPTQSTPGRRPHSETVTRGSWHTRAPSQKVQPPLRPRETALWLSASKDQFCPVSPLPRRQPLHIPYALGRRQPGGGQGGTHSVLRRALLTAPGDLLCPASGGRVSLGANMGVRSEPGGGPGASVGRKESPETGMAVFPTVQSRCLQARSELQRSTRKRHGMPGHLELPPTGPPKEARPGGKGARLGGKGSLGS